MLRDLIRNELLSDKLYEITSEVVEGLSRDVIETLMWCLSRNEKEICTNFKNIIDEFIRAYPILRMFKYMSTEVIHEALTTLDKNILNTALQIVRRYFEALIKGVITHDDMVPVVVKKDMLLEGRVIPKGALILININKALMLEAASYVNIVIP